MLPDDNSNGLKFGRKTRTHEVEASPDSLAILLPLNTCCWLTKILKDLGQAGVH